jgi:hypothetical protein
MIAVSGVTAIISKLGRSFPHWLASKIATTEVCGVQVTLCCSSLAQVPARVDCLQCDVRGSVTPPVLNQWTGVS